MDHQREKLEKIEDKIDKIAGLGGIPNSVILEEKTKQQETIQRLENIDTDDPNFLDRSILFNNLNQK